MTDTMFRRESEMAPAAVNWLKSAGLLVRSEFVTPWGMCDLVGLSFNPVNVAQRLSLGQGKAIGSITGAALLLQIPDVNTRKSITTVKLIRECGPAIPKEVISNELDRLFEGRFVIPSPRGRLQKRNGWLPLQERIVTIELKLRRIGTALEQAKNNLGIGGEAYVGLPLDVACRISSSHRHRCEFVDAGVGLLGVAHRKCELIIPPAKRNDRINEAVQLYCVEKFWRTRVKDS
jgi:hypothetical protein